MSRGPHTATPPLRWTLSGLTVDCPRPDGTLTRVLHGVDLTVEAGEVVGLVGPSGSGKSMLVRAALGLVPGAQVQGRSELHDSTTSRPATPGADLGLAFQEAAASLDPTQRLGPALQEVLRRHGRTDAPADLLEEVRLTPPERFLSRLPHELSGGQAQRAGLALSLASGPSFWVWDEATTALDPHLQAELLHLLRTVVQRRGLGALVISHDPALLAQVVDRTVHLEDGRRVPAPPLPVPPSPRPARPTGPPLLTLEAVHLQVAHPPRAIVHGLDATVHHGETIALVGASGCGKTTLARGLAGLLPLQAGRLHWHTATRPRWQRAQLVHQDPLAALDPRWTLGRSLRHPLQCHGLDPQHLDGLLQAVDLPRALLDRRPHQVSGGQRQRACLARALALQPDLLLADEVTSALDAEVAHAVRALVLELVRQRNLAALFITHDLSLAAATHTVWVMEAGRLVAQGPPEQVLQRGVHPAVDQLLGGAA